jgi:Anti-sigma factor NepR
LSVTKRGKSGDAGRKNGSGGPPNPPKRKQRTADLGRALRSVYDDTLRESVPDEFNDLLGKLS